MNSEEQTDDDIQLTHQANIKADVAGYVIGAAILFVMFAFSGFLY